MSKSKKTTQTTRREIPAWLEAGSEQAVGLARKIAGRPYQAYSGERIAGLAPGEERAINMANTGVGAYQADLDASRELVGQGSRAFTDLSDEERQAYMNPYIQGALEPALREVREQGERDKRSVGQAAGRVSAFGGARQAILESEAKRGTLEAVGDVSARGYHAAFESAANRFDADRAAARAGAEQYRALGAQAQSQMTQDMQNLLTTGGLQRTLEQAGIDFDYQQFAEARDWDLTNLQPLIATLSSVPHGETSTTTSKQKSGKLGTILGIAATAAGAYFTGGASLALQGASGGFFKKIGVGLAENLGGGGESPVGKQTPPYATPGFNPQAGYIPPGFTNKDLGLTLPTYSPTVLPNYGNTYTSTFGG